MLRERRRSTSRRRDLPSRRNVIGGLYSPSDEKAFDILRVKVALSGDNRVRT